MAKAQVLDEHHLMRFVPYKQQLRNPETDAFEGIVNSAFTMRVTDKGGLSVTWVEHYGPKSPATIATAASAFRDSLDSGKIGAKSCFSIGVTGFVRKTAAEHGKKIRLVPAPDGPNTGHVEIHRFSDEDRQLLDALAIDVFTDHHLVANMKLS